jgi:predicted MFS family arabinose efflux permease
MSHAAAHHRPSVNERTLLFVLVAVQFTHIMDFMIMMPLGSHLMRVFGIRTDQFGLLVATYGWAAALTGFFGGFVLDRFDRKHALLWLYGGFSLATLACALAPGYHFLLLARLAAGACGGVAGSVVTAMVGDVFPAARRGRALGAVMMAFPIASVLGVPTGLWLADKFEWHAPFFLLAGVSAGILVVAWRALPALRPSHPAAHPWRQMKAIVAQPVHQRGFMLSAALIFGGACIVPFLAPSMVANVGLREDQLWLLYLGGGLCAACSTPLIGRLADRHDKLHVLGWLSLGAATAGLLITNLPRVPVPVAMLAVAFFMVMMSGRFTPAMALVSNAVEPRFRGGFMSVNSSVQQAAMGLANFTSGLLVTQDDATGRLEGFPRAGLVAVVAFGLTFFFAARLRALAPHAARPGHVEAEAAPAAP